MRHPRSNPNRRDSLGSTPDGYRVCNSPTQLKMASSTPRGRSKRASAMTKKVIAFEFVVPTVLAVALGVVLSIGAVFLTDKYLGPIDQAEANFSATAEQ